MDWGLIGTVFAVIFGFTTIYLTIKLKKRRKPVWSYKTTKIIGLGSDAPTELKLLFNDKQVLEVYRTLLVFFNMGNTSIRKEDVSDVISVRFKGADFLRDAYAMVVGKRENRVEIVNRDTNSFEIYFSFLDHNDGVIVEVLHTKYEQIDCGGYILEAGKPRYIGEFKPQRPEGFKTLMAMFAVLAVGLLWGLVSSIATAIQEPGSWGDTAGIVFLVGILIFSVLYSRPRRFLQFLLFPSWSRWDYKKESVM
ncbi:hypothetical protein ACFLV1_00505 [Chloroflexota bacterium]